MKSNHIVVLSLIMVCIFVSAESLASSEDISIEQAAVIALESDSAISMQGNVPIGYSISATSTSSDNGSAPATLAKSAQIDALVAAQDHSYWLKVWGSMCENAQLGHKVRKIGSAELNRITKTGDHTSLTHKFKRYLHNSCEDTETGNGKEGDMLPSKGGFFGNSYGGYRNIRQKNVQRSLEVLLEMVATQNCTFTDQVKDLQRIVDLKDQELKAALENKVEGQAQQACNNWWDRSLAVFGVLSGVGNIVLITMLTR